MPDYRIFRTEEFEKTLSKLDQSISKRIEKKLVDHVYEQWKEEPHFGLNIKKLRGYDPDTWRYRIGDYRIFYEVDEEDKIVGLLTIDDRKDAYK